LPSPSRSLGHLDIMAAVCEATMMSNRSWMCDCLVHWRRTSWGGGLGRGVILPVFLTRRSVRDCVTLASAYYDTAGDGVSAPTLGTGA
jgi:hypothetical protein